MLSMSPTVPEPNQDERSSFCFWEASRNGCWTKPSAVARLFCFAACCCFGWLSITCLGMVGTGGGGGTDRLRLLKPLPPAAAAAMAAAVPAAFIDKLFLLLTLLLGDAAAAARAAVRDPCGLGDRNVRSDMDDMDLIDDELPRRRRVGAPVGDTTTPSLASLPPPSPMARFMLGTGLRGRRVPSDEIEELRRIVRLVWTAATLVGGVGKALRAAAAAADESERLLYAETAAVAAPGLTDAAVGG